MFYFKMFPISRFTLKFIHGHLIEKKLIQLQSPKSDSAKIKLLEFIRAERTLLFGAFSSTVTKNQKNDVWEKITKKQ